jgi:hypothetical protein
MIFDSISSEKSRRTSTKIPGILATFEISILGQPLLRMSLKQ